MKQFQVIIILIVLGLLTYNNPQASELPRFYGIYVAQNDRYVEVVRTEKIKEIKFNILRRKQVGVDCNVRKAINRKSFVKTDLDKFNRNGFLVIQDEYWSDFQLFRVDYKKETLKHRSFIVIGTDYGCGAKGMVYSYEGLVKPVKPTEVRIRKAKVGENAYIYVPASPLKGGFYLIDYKKNGKAFLGYNAIYLSDPPTAKEKKAFDITVKYFKYIFEKNYGKAFMLLSPKAMSQAKYTKEMFVDSIKSLPLKEVEVLYAEVRGKSIWVYVNFMLNNNVQDIDRVALSTDEQKIYITDAPGL